MAAVLSASLAAGGSFGWLGKGRQKVQSLGQTHRPALHPGSPIQMGKMILCASLNSPGSDDAKLFRIVLW